MAVQETALRRAPSWEAKPAAGHRDHGGGFGPLTATRRQVPASHGAARNGRRAHPPGAIPTFWSHSPPSTTKTAPVIQSPAGEAR